MPTTTRTTSFTAALRQVELNMVNYAVPHLRGKWQGLDVSKQREMRAHELTHYTIQVPMQYEDLDSYRATIKPNLPWADDHFEERVCGAPINPGKEWANWPWGKNADKFRELDDPFIKPEDWAYLAAMIDADGSIIIREQEGRKSACIVIDQVDHPFMKELRDTYGIGQSLREQNTNNPLSDRPLLRWQISQREQLKWVLGHVMPYLRLKRLQAMDAFDTIPDFDRRNVGEKGREPIFDHNYMQRFWPKYAGMTAGGFIDQEKIDRYGLLPRHGIFYPYGDLDDVVNELALDPTTRQAVLPIFFPEDTGRRVGRKPCSMYYHFMLTADSKLDITYPMRSCDMVRHLRDDIYLTVRLLLWVLNRLRDRDDFWLRVNPGLFVMNIANLHVFENDMIRLKKGHSHDR